MLEPPRIRPRAVFCWLLPCSDRSDLIATCVVDLRLVSAGDLPAHDVAPVIVGFCVAVGVGKGLSDDAPCVAVECTLLRGG